MTDKTDPNAPTSAARRLRLEQFARDAERARDEYDSVGRTIDERTALLREQRLAREAAERSAGKPAARKKAVRKSK